MSEVAETGQAAPQQVEGGGQTDAGASEPSVSRQPNENEKGRARIDIGENGGGRDNDGMYAGKYKTVDDLVKGYKNAESELGRLKREKRPEAPENYELSFEDESAKEFFTQSEAWEPMSEVFREANLTQEQVDAVLNKYFEISTNRQEDFSEQIQKLEQEGVISSINGFAEKNLSEDEYDVLASMTTTPEQTRLMNKMIKLTAEKNIPADPGKSTPMASASELRQQAQEIRNQRGFRMSREMQKEYMNLVSQAHDAEKRK